MTTRSQTIVIPLYGDIDSALKYFSSLDLNLQNVEIVFVYAIAPSKVFGTSRRRNRTNIPSKILRVIESDMISTVNSRIQEILPHVPPERFKYKFEIGSWVEVIQSVVKNIKCDLLLLGYKEENIIQRLFTGFYFMIFRIPSITTLVVKAP